MSSFSLSGGVEVMGFISPTDTNDTYPVIDPLYGVDGFRNVNTLSDLDLIPEPRRRAGMVVGVSGGTDYYKLNSSPWNFDFTDWSVFNTGDTYTTGGTYSNGIITFDYNTGGVYQVSGLYTGQTSYVNLLTTGVGLSGDSTTGNVTIINTDPDQVVTISGGTGILTGGTYPNFIIENTLPDQTVVLNNGTNIRVTGTYPNFTIDVTGLTDNNTYTTGFTYQNNTFTISDSSGNTLNATINSVTGLTVNGILSATTISGGTFYGDGSNLTNTPDKYITDLSFNNSNYNLTVTRNDLWSDTVSLGILSSDMTITGGTYDAITGTATFTNNSGGTFNVTGFIVGYTDIRTTGFTYSENTFYITDTSGNTFSASINSVTGLTVNGNLTVSGTTFLKGLSATTIGSSGNCVDDIYVSNIHSCSPLNINPLDEGNVYFGSTSGVTIDVTNNRVGIGTTSPSSALNIKTIINSNVGNPGLRVSGSVNYIGMQYDEDLGPVFYTNYVGANNSFLFKGSTYQNLAAIGTDGIFSCNTNGKISNFNSNGYINLWNGVSGDMEVVVATNNGIKFLTNNIERVRISNTGNVGIGTISPREKLDVSGNTIITGNLTVSGITGTTWFSGNSSSDLVRVTQTGSGNALVVEDSANPDSTPFRIDTSGNTAIGVTTSPLSFKLEVNGTSMFRNNMSLNQALFSEVYTYNSVTDLNKVNLSVGRFHDHNDGAVDIGYTAQLGWYKRQSSNISLARSIDIPITFTSGSSGTIGQFNSINTNFQIGEGSTVTTPFVAHAVSATKGTTGTVTSFTGFDVQDNSVSNTTYGFRSRLTSGSGKYGLYFDGTANNYFNGNVGIGTLTPREKLDVSGNTIITGNLTVSGLTATTISASTISAPGSTTQVIYNNGGVLSAHTGLVYSDNTNTLIVGQSGATTASNGEIILKRFTTGTGIGGIRAEQTGNGVEIGGTSYYDKIMTTNGAGIRFWTWVTGTTSNAERMRITSGTGTTWGVGIGTTTPGARLDVRAQGDLSTDIAFRVRNSGDTANLVSVTGEGVLNLANLGDTSKIAINSTTLGQLAIAIGSGQSGLRTTCVGFGNTANGQDGNIFGYGNNGVSLGACGTIFGSNNTHTIGIVVGSSNSGSGSVIVGSNNAIGGSGPTNNAMFVFGAGMTETSGNALLPGTFMFGSYTTTGNKAGLTFKSRDKNHLLLGYDIMNATYSSQNGTNWLGVKSGTAPDGAIDAFQLYSADITAGNAAPHFRTENGSIVKLYQETTGVTTSTLISNAGTTITDTDTFDGYTLQQVVKALRNLGVLQ